MRAATAAVIASIVACVAHAQPSNDACATATAIGVNDTATGDTTSATTDLPDVDCLGSSSATHDVWFALTPASSGVLTVASCDSDFDTVLAAYDGGCAGGEAACSNSGFGACTDTSRARITLEVSAGTDYRVRLAGLDGASGMYELTTTFTPAPANDDCINATPIFEDDVLVGSHAGATSELDPIVFQCRLNRTEGDVWYAFTPTESKQYQVLTCPEMAAPGITSVGIFESLDGTCDVTIELGCEEQNFLECNFEGLATGGVIDWFGSSGTTYYIRVSRGPSQAGGPIRVELRELPTLAGACCMGDGSCLDDQTESDCVFAGGTYLGDYLVCGQGSAFCEQPNNTCAGATDLLLDEQILAFDPRGNTRTGNASCVSAAQDHDSWWRFQAASPGRYRISTCGSTFGARLALYADCMDADNGDFACTFVDTSLQCPDLTDASLAVELGAGESVLIRVSGHLNDDLGITDLIDLLVSLDVAPIGPCCMPDESCIDTTEAACSAAGGAWAGPFADCAECPMLPPHNDCANAATLVVDGPAVPLDLPSATLTSLPSDCFLFGSPPIGDVWATVDVIAGYTYRVSGSTDFSFFGPLAVRTSCDPDAEVIACGGGSVLFEAPATGSVMVWFAEDAPVPLNAFAELIDFPVGGCCAAGRCVVRTELDCSALGGIYLGDDIECDPTGAVADLFATIEAGDGSCVQAPTVDTISVTDAMMVDNISVTLDLQHSNPGSLLVTLEGPNGATVELMNLPGYFNSGDCSCGSIGGLFGADGSFAFSDAAAMSFHEWGRLNPPVGFGGAPSIPSGLYRPAGCQNGASTLTGAFGGSDSAGDWTLSIQHRAQAVGQEGGVLRGWSLSINGGDTDCPNCPCETDGDASVVSVADLLEYLAQWFVQDPAAERDGVPGVGVTDLLAFLSCWFTSSGGPCIG